jgi:hypothetical protein
LWMWTFATHENCSKFQFRNIKNHTTTQLLNGVHSKFSCQILLCLLIECWGWVKNWECVLWQIPLKAKGMFGRHTVLWFKPSLHKLIQINPIKAIHPPKPICNAMVLWFNPNNPNNPTGKSSIQRSIQSPNSTQTKLKTVPFSICEHWQLNVTNVIQFRMIFFIVHYALNHQQGAKINVVQISLSPPKKTQFYPLSVSSLSANWDLPGGSIPHFGA